MKYFLSFFIVLSVLQVTQAQSTSSGAVYQVDSTYEVKGFAGTKEVSAAGKQGLVQPVLLNLEEVMKSIGYPQTAKDRKIEGTVVMRIQVDENGKFKQYYVVKEGHELLKSEVEKHLHELKFSPATNGGKPTSFWVNVPFSFKLKP